MGGRMSDGRTILIAQTGSTNADLRAQSRDWPEGQWLRAESQLAGRGRLGRSWQGGLGNLYTSTLVRLRESDPPMTGLSLMVGVAVYDALYGLIPDTALMLKWPNDIMVGAAKLAGMLLEREGDAIIVGIGVNVTAAPELPDRPTVALTALAGGSDIVAAAVQTALVEAFDRWLGVWRAGGLDSIIPAWLARAHPVGMPLSVSAGKEGPQLGRFGGLDRSGALLLDLDDGSRLIVHSGDVGILP